MINLNIFALCSSCSYRNHINEHSINLLKSCRICGSRDLQHASYRKSEFAVEFKEVFGIDIKDDDDTIHPGALCRSHEILFQRFRRHKEMGTIFKTCVQLKTFIAHNDDCDICYIRHVRGRKKRKRTNNLQPNFREIVLPSHKKKANEEKSDSAIPDPNLIEEALKIVDSTNDAVDKESLVKTFFQLQSKDRIQVLSNILENLTNEEAAAMAFKLGKREEKAVSDDAEAVSKEYLERTELLSFDSFKWLRKRNKILLQFIQGMTNFDFETSTEPEKITCCRAMEQIYAMRFHKLVAPISFLISLNVYTKTSSRQVVDMLSKTSPSGSYSTLSSWIAKSGSSAPLCPPGTVIAGFDNEQVIGYKRGIGPHQKSRSSVITTQVYIPLPTPPEVPMNLQMQENLKPKIFFSTEHFDLRIRHAEQHNLIALKEELLEEKKKFEKEVTEIKDQTSEEIEYLEKLHYEQLHHFIQNAINTVSEEQYGATSQFGDQIEETMHHAERMKNILVCLLWGEENFETQTNL